MLLLGIDLGTSSVKVSVVDADTQQLIAAASYPDQEAEVLAPQPGWAEQRADQWWEQVVQAILKCHATGRYQPSEIGAIGIAYQMHGLVVVDQHQQVLRNPIIWCDSRAVPLGEHAFEAIGRDQCLSTLLNAPGNFTASKLAWVRAHEPALYEQIHQVMLPGDYIALKMTGEVTTTVSALSEGMFWDFKHQELSKDLFQHYQFSTSFIPPIQPVFSVHGPLQSSVALQLGLKVGTVVSYKAGDQLNNALSLNVLEPGEVATTAGTSGVIYAVHDQLFADPLSRINSFAHVNHGPEQTRIGVLLCINGTGIFNSWIKQRIAGQSTYADLNLAAASVAIGSEGLVALPFGNGAERMFANRMVGAHLHGLDFHKHGSAHLARATQEGIAFALRYGLDIMREQGMDPNSIRASQANLFLSPVFSSVFSSVNDLVVEFYEGDGSYGAALGAGIGAGFYRSPAEACKLRKPINRIEPDPSPVYQDAYAHWKELLDRTLSFL
jgi:xylulokinase